MEDKRIRSAWEIAMERADRLGALTPEEQRQQEEKEHRPLGEGLAEKYLSGLPMRDLESQFGRFGGSKAAWVKRGFFDALVRAIRLDDREKSERSIVAVRSFSSTKVVNEIASSVEALIHDYDLAKEKERQSRSPELGKHALDRLSDMGIAGSALRPNLNAVATWQAAGTDLEAKYYGQLASLSQQLHEVLSQEFTP